MPDHLVVLTKQFEALHMNSSNVNMVNTTVYELEIPVSVNLHV